MLAHSNPPIHTRSSHASRRLALLVMTILATFATGCATLDSAPDQGKPEHDSEPLVNSEQQSLSEKSGRTMPPATASLKPTPETPIAVTPLTITSRQRTGTLANRSLSEVSGLASATSSPGVLFAINDSGNAATLYALDQTGKHLDHWKLAVRNRDWEDMATITIDGQPHLIIGDTGDNLRVHRENWLHVFAEPVPDQATTEPLSPVMSVRYVYDNGPRNVEAFAAIQNTLYMISKEPVSRAGPVASHVYELTIPASYAGQLLTAQQIATLPQSKTTLESRLAAAMAGVDLNHITAMDFDQSGRTAYLLTYRHVLQIRREPSQTWAQAFASENKRLHSHNLEQAEALAVSRDQIVWFTSEKRPAPLWALPVAPQL